MDIAFVRGQRLKAYETQTVEPLLSRHTVVGFSGKTISRAPDSIELPVERYPCPEDYLGKLPAQFEKAGRAVLSKTQTNQRLLGIEERLRDFDIIHAKDLTHGFSYQAARVREEQGNQAGFVLTVAQNIPFHRPRKLGVTFGNEEKRSFVRQAADAFIAVSKQAKGALMIEGVPQERIHTIPYGIDTDRFSPTEPSPEAQRRFGFEPEPCNLLYVGSLIERKGVRTLLHAYRLLTLSWDESDEVPHLHFVGSGPLREGLQRLCRRWETEDSVHFHGRVPFGDIDKVYNLADVFVIPSHATEQWQEQFGFVTAEAMASGLPVIGTQSGAIPEVIGGGGLMVPPANPTALSEVLEELCLHPERRTSLGKEARDRALRRYDSVKVAEQYEQVYLDVLESVTD